MTSVLVTRPQEDAQKLSEELVRLGYEVFLEPMLQIHTIEDAAVDLHNVQGLLFTSANGVRAFSALKDTRTLPAYCVGSSTAYEARIHGFKHIHTADGDVDKLAELVSSKCTPAAGVLFHAAASKLAGDLDGLLVDKGFIYRRNVLYESIHTESLTEQTITAIMANKIDAVLLFSPRTARGFVEKIKKADLLGYIGQLSLFCLSLNVENEVKALNWKNVATADTPTQQALLTMLKEKMG